ncbi:flippase [Methanococcoides methylutens]|uniref:Uncharacterized protein n=1 Tax=Methanococcoides methylutens MM1 TaxID=1434104 RepID=A0A0E3WZ05_METMT|nr:flippase [Methanococcoides methylutens]AKB84299.1 hypothetical protein MCMEM_0246 [Methanococcoides methylutens MM1]
MFKPNFTKTMKDIQWSFISLAVTSFSHLLLRIVLGKELGPTGLGIYTLVFTIYMFGMQFAAFGIGAALTKYVAQYSDEQEKIKEFVSSGIIASLVSGSAISILLYSLSSTISIQLFHNPEMTELLKLTAFCIPFIAIQKSVIGTLNGLRKMKSYAVVNIVQNVSIMLISIILVLFLDMNVRGAIVGFVIPTILIGTISLIFVKNYLTTKQALIKTVLKEVSIFGFYVVLANSIGIINTQIDSILIGHFMNSTDVGYYAVAVIFMSGITLLPQATQRVTTAAIAKYYAENDLESVREVIKGTMKKTFLLTIIITLFFALFGKNLIEIIFTEEFIPAYAPLLILTIGYAIYATFVSVGSCLSSIGKVEIVFKISAVCAVMNTLLNIALIPKYGLIGAASATTASLLFTTLINLYFIKRYTYEKNIMGI